MSFGHFSDHRSDQRLASGFKFGKFNRLDGHADKPPRIFLCQWFACGREDLCHRPIMADQIDKECPAQLVPYPLVGEKVAHIKQVARVLAIESCDDLAGIEIGK